MGPQCRETVVDSFIHYRNIDIQLLSTAAFVLQLQNGVVAIEILWPVGPTLFPVRTFIEQRLFQGKTAWM
jgi:hypothetical protein